MKVHSWCGVVVVLVISGCGGADPGEPTVTAPAGPTPESVAKPPDAVPKPRVSRRKKPVRLDMMMIKALFGNYPTVSGDVVNQATPAQVALGRTLYQSEHLSKNGDVSCASCHDLANYGQDGKRAASRVDGTRGSRNTPTTWNAFRHFAQLWDYRAANVEEQAMMALLDSTQHGLVDEADLVAKISARPELVAAFKEAFPGDQPLTGAHVGLAIGAFQRTLVTRSPWDDFIEGDGKALSNDEKLGFKKFMDVGCGSCHMSRLLGGNMPQKIGVFSPYPDQTDTGRYRQSGNDSEKFFFKVPSLLNVEKTAPYNHDGAVATLEESVRQMAKIQLAKDLTDEEVASIVAFLKALTGKLPADIMANGR